MIECAQGSPDIGHFARIQETMAAGSSKSRESTARGLMTIHSDPHRETDVKQHRMDTSSKDGRGKGVRSIRIAFLSGHKADRPTLVNCRVHAGKTMAQILTEASAGKPWFHLPRPV